MKNFAVIENNKVINIIVADTYEIAQTVTNNKETIEINNNFMVGIEWFKENNVWYSPKPFSSWIFNEETNEWVAPIPYPTIEEGSDEIYTWDENTTSWLLLPPSN